MNFIERWFGISPDGGNGLLEAVLVMAIVAVIAVAIQRRQVVVRAAELIRESVGEVFDSLQRLRLTNTSDATVTANGHAARRVEVSDFQESKR